MLSISPPLNSSVCIVRAASFSALAASAASPETNASAVGPWSNALSASAPASSAARSDSEFLTIRNFVPVSRSLMRSSAACATEIPR